MVLKRLNFFQYPRNWNNFVTKRTMLYMNNKPAMSWSMMKSSPFRK